MFSNHGHALIHLSRYPDARVRDVAQAVGITERAAQTILSDLVAAGYVTANRIGRRNHYRVHPDTALRHPAESGHTVGEVLSVFAGDPAEQSAAGQ